MNDGADVVEFSGFSRRRMLRRMCVLLVWTGIAAGSGAMAATPAAPLVLTGTQATYSLTTALVADTPIQVRNVPADARQLPLLRDYIQRRMEELGPLFASATAVVSLTNALPTDPLYRFARQANVRIVNIDAAIPWQHDMAGVGLTPQPRTSADWAEGREPSTDEAAVAPYFWLSLSNAVRMADIIAHDLAALFPDSAPAIGRNLTALRHELLEQRDAYQRRILDGGADVVFALTGDFVYLTNDLGLFVDGYFIQQDVRWTAEDLAALTRHLRERGITVVIHRWQPSEAIQEAVRAGGARLVVLDPADPGMVQDRALVPDGLQRILRANLQALQDALAAGGT